FLAEQMRDIGVQQERIFEFDVGFSGFQDASKASSVQHGDKHDKSNVILFVGRIDRTKGVFDLLAASESLLRSSDNVEVVYVGDGPALGDLRKLVSDKGLDNRVQCLGRLSHEELPSLVSAASVMVTPTLREFPEGRCMAAMEALAVGVPVIAPNSGPFPYLVK